MEKAHENRMNLEIFFLDFQQAFDSIKRRELMYALKQLGIAPKLRRLIKMTLKRTVVSIRTQVGETEELLVNKGVKQGDSLSATLFNLSLEYVIRKINKSTLRTGGKQIIAYADDLALIAKNRKILKEMIEEITTEGNKMGLRINEDKTKIMRTGRKLENKAIQIGEYKFEEVKKFKYLGVMMCSDGEREMEIKEKILGANRAFYSNKNLLKSKILTKGAKMKIYETIIRPVIMYAAETMTMTKKDEEDLRIVERKILRTILGPIKTGNNEFRIRMNHEIMEEINGEDVIKKIKRQRIKWLGHVWRAGPDTTIFSILQWEPRGRRRRGRPRSTWLKEVEQDLKNAGCHDWRREAMDRKKWRDISKSV